MNQPILRIVSGGQTGADRAALDWAMKNGIPHGGWCPKGRRAEDGPIDAKYQLQETPSANYLQRTEWNVRDSDGTVIFSIAKQLTGGSKKTAAFSKKHKKPLLHLSVEKKEESAERLICFLDDNKVHVLNVAGPPKAKEPAVAGFVQATLNELRKPLLYIVDDPRMTFFYTSVFDHLPQEWSSTWVRRFEDHQGALEAFEATPLRPDMLIATYVKRGKRGTIINGLHLLSECKKIAPTLKTVLTSVFPGTGQIAQSDFRPDAFLHKGIHEEKAAAKILKKLLAPLWQEHS